jgi:hypothetical protein
MRQPARRRWHQSPGAGSLKLPAGGRVCHGRVGFDASADRAYPGCPVPIPATVSRRRTSGPADRRGEAPARLARIHVTGVRPLWSPCGRLLGRRVTAPRRETVRPPLPPSAAGATATGCATTQTESAPAYRSCACKDGVLRKTACTLLPPDQPDDGYAHLPAKTRSRQRQSRPTYESHRKGPGEPRGMSLLAHEGPVPQYLSQPKPHRLSPVEDRLDDIRRRTGERQEAADVGVGHAFPLYEGLPADLRRTSGRSRALAQLRGGPRGSG